MITADHTVLDDDQEPRLHHRNVVVGQDLATQGIQSYPRETESAHETQRNLRKFSRPEENPRSIHTRQVLWNLSKPAKG